LPRHTPPPYNKIDDKLFRVRGVYDGAGCVSKEKRPGKNPKMPADKNSLLDGLSIGWGRLCVNKTSPQGMGRGCPDKKATSCGEYFPMKTADFVSAAGIVVSENSLHP